MVKKKLPVGVDDFKKIIEDDYYFVDKSMFIDELLNKKSEVTLLPRPR
ncbi:MAG: AAA family ATPase, partial [Fusobacteriaceae bacterium]